MFGLDWSELALIAVVAVVIIGPKDLPEAVRGVARFVQKLRRMAGEFQGQVDEVVREANLGDVRNQINDIRNFDFKSVVEKEIDKDGTLRKGFAEDPLKDAFSPGGSGATVTPPPPAWSPPTPAADAPAFVPPGTTPPLVTTPPPAPVAQPAAAPAFVPPDTSPPRNPV
jgi:sec-independent protein translocase protein TatB